MAHHWLLGLACTRPVQFLSLFPTQVVPHQRPTHLKIPPRGLAFYELKMRPTCWSSQGYSCPSCFPSEGPKDITLSHADCHMVPMHLSQFHHPACSLARPASRLFLPLPSHPECPPPSNRTSPTSSHYLFTHTNNLPPPRVLCYLEIALISEMALGGSLGRTRVSADQEMEVQGSSQRHLTGRSSSLD